MAPNPHVAAIDQSDLPTLENQILTGGTYGATKLAKEDQWMANLDYKAFKEDIQVRCSRRGHSRRPCPAICLARTRLSRSAVSLA